VGVAKIFVEVHYVQYSKRVLRFAFRAGTCRLSVGRKRNGEN
jgi:hypothetical protein